MSTMVTAADLWNEPESFWAAVGVLTTVLTTALSLVAAPWIAMRVQGSRRRLLCSMLPATPLIPEYSGLEVSYNGHPLTHPQVVEIQLTCRGKHDIPSSAFNDGQPMRLDVGAMIINVLRVESSPDGTSAPKWEVDGTSVVIGPSLIKKNQTLSFSLLVDGWQPVLVCPPTLIDIDVDVVDRMPGLDELSLRGKVLLAVAWSGFAALTTIIVIAVPESLTVVGPLKELGWWPW